MTAPVNAAFYADPKGLTELRTSARANDPAALKEVAKQFESLFTKMLLKSMREANSNFGDSMLSSDQTEFYEGMFDDQLAVQLSQGKGLGLADMLVRQLSQGGGVATQPKEPTSTQGVDPALPQASIAGPAPIAASREEFIRNNWPHAQKAAREIGVDPHALLAQAALETGWGKSVPSTMAGDCSFNLFGIKAGSQWSGATVSVPTLEFEAGIAVRKVERFRSYESAADSFADYAKLIGNNPRYENARGSGSDIASFAAALQEGGYATDPQYARKVIAVAEQLRSLVKPDAVKSTPDLPIAGYAGVRS
jgi:flagellar protein FlgJ